MIEGRPTPAEDPAQEEHQPDIDMDAHGENDPLEAALVH